MTTPTLTYRTDRNGFPVEQCHRCLGEGKLRAFSLQGGNCFKCGGTGWVHPRTVADFADRYINAVRAARAVSMGTYVTVNPDGSREYRTGPQVGDQVRDEYCSRKPAAERGPWRTIVAVRTTARLVGGGYDGDREFLTLEVMVTLDDGTVVRGWGQVWERRPDTEALAALREDLAAQARAAYERTLKRRRSR